MPLRPHQSDVLPGHREPAEATGAATSDGDDARTDLPLDPLAPSRRIKAGDAPLARLLDDRGRAVR